MTKLGTLVFLIMSLSAYRPLQAQDYSLEDCIRIALANNQHVLNSQLEIQSASYRTKEAKSALLPTINITAQSLYYKDLRAQYAPASAFGGPEGEYTRMTLNMKQTTTATLQITHNIYNQAAMTALKAARVSQETSRLQDKVAREDLVFDVTSTYYTVQVLNDNLNRLEDNIKNLERTTIVNSILWTNELVSENVHNRVLINLENLRNEYENQRVLADQNLNLLRYLMDVPPGEPFTIQAFNYDETLTSAVSADYSKRTDIQLQQALVKLSRLEKKGVIAGYFPVLTNSISYGYTAYYDEFGPGRQINSDWIKSSYFALTLKVPVFDGFQKQNQIRQKEITIQKNINTLKMMEANANREVRDAEQNYNANKNLLMSNRKSLELAEKLFSSAQAEYENGITSVTELLDAQNDLSNARSNYSSALLNLKLAESTLKKANGTLLAL